MILKGITWQAGGTTDHVLLGFLPEELRELIGPSGGFILHHGAIHFRGCSDEPEWNCLRTLYHGAGSIRTLYPHLDVDDIPFAQDQLGDQYLLRGVEVIRLDAETGEQTRFAKCLHEFVSGIEDGIEDYLNVSLRHRLEPGQALHAYPPFCTVESGLDGSSLAPVSCMELLRFHADFARQIAGMPDGSQYRVEVVE
jgi:hypothetical protein